MQADVQVAGDVRGSQMRPIATQPSRFSEDRQWLKGSLPHSLKWFNCECQQAPTHRLKLICCPVTAREQPVIAVESRLFQVFAAVQELS